MVNSFSLRRKFLMKDNKHHLVPQEFPARSSPGGTIKFEIMRKGKKAKKSVPKMSLKGYVPRLEDQFMIKSGEHCFLKSIYSIAELSYSYPTIDLSSAMTWYRLY